jgi:hypothetical protein
MQKQPTPEQVEQRFGPRPSQGNSLRVHCAQDWIDAANIVRSRTEKKTVVWFVQYGKEHLEEVDETEAVFGQILSSYSFSRDRTTPSTKIKNHVFSDTPEFCVQEVTVKKVLRVEYVPLKETRTVVRAASANIVHLKHRRLCQASVLRKVAREKNPIYIIGHCFRFEYAKRFEIVDLPVKEAEKRALLTERGRSIILQLDDKNWTFGTLGGLLNDEQKKGEATRSRGDQVFVEICRQEGPDSLVYTMQQLLAKLKSKELLFPRGSFGCVFLDVPAMLPHPSSVAYWFKCFACDCWRVCSEHTRDTVLRTGHFVCSGPCGLLRSGGIS